MLHVTLGFKVSIEELAVILVGFSLCVMCFFFPIFENSSFFIYLVMHIRFATVSFLVLSGCWGSLCESCLVWGFVCLLHIYDILFLSLWKFSSMILLNVVFAIYLWLFYLNYAYNLKTLFLMVSHIWSMFLSCALNKIIFSACLFMFLYLSSSPNILSSI